MHREGKWLAQEGGGIAMIWTPSILHLCSMISLSKGSREIFKVHRALPPFYLHPFCSLHTSQLPSSHWGDHTHTHTHTAHALAVSAVWISWVSKNSGYHIDWSFLLSPKHLLLVIPWCLRNKSEGRDPKTTAIGSQVSRYGYNSTLYFSFFSSRMRIII
jgi:hypothetical protein